MTNPAMVIPDAMPAILNLVKATKKGGVAQKTLELVHLRASQINGCSFCVDMGARAAKKAGESDERLFAVAAWIGLTNLFNRVNVTTRQLAGQWPQAAEAEASSAKDHAVA